MQYRMNRSIHLACEMPSPSRASDRHSRISVRHLHHRGAPLKRLAPPDDIIPLPVSMRHHRKAMVSKSGGEIQKSDRRFADRRRQRAKNTQGRECNSDKSECQHDGLPSNAANEFRCTPSGDWKTVSQNLKQNCRHHVSISLSIVFFSPIQKMPAIIGFLSARNCAAPLTVPRDFQLLTARTPINHAAPRSSARCTPVPRA